ncbi:MAG: lipid II flippase MurJ [Pyramidobacter sp.]|nr:lipid II flippase MurJ [Pyramidobacter sp.]
MKTHIQKMLKWTFGVQKTRDGTLGSVIFTALSKPMGYLRTLLLAWLFGVRAEMDAYHVAAGILYLCFLLAQNVLESALLPQLVRRSREEAEALMAWTFRTVIIAFGVCAALMALFPEDIVRFFARRFDEARMSQAASMLIVLIPWSASVTIQSLLAVWNTYSQRYSLAAAFTFATNFLLIPLLILMSPLLGVMAIPAAQSAVYAVLAFLMWRVTQDFPCAWRRKLSVPAEHLCRLAHDSLLCVGIVGASSLYQLVDRYFASGLPAGNISAINYAGQIYMFPLSIMAPACMIYLNRASQVVRQGGDSDSYLETVMSMSWLYLFPPSCVLVCLARPAVLFFLGYGAFDANAVVLTVPCVSASAWALPLLLWGQFLVRHAQAEGKLRTILCVSYGALLLNSFLDWLFVPRWGAPGLCMATGIAWGGSALIYVAILVPGALKNVLKQVWLPSVVFGLLSAALLLPLTGIMIPLCAGALLLALYFFLGEKLGFFSAIPSDWRPLSILKLLFRRFVCAH